MKFKPLMMFITNGNTGTFNTGQTETKSLNDKYPDCQTRVPNHLGRTKGAVGKYFPLANGGRGKGLICGGVDRKQW